MSLPDLPKKRIQELFAKNEINHELFCYLSTVANLNFVDSKLILRALQYTNTDDEAMIVLSLGNTGWFPDSSWLPDPWVAYFLLLNQKYSAICSLNNEYREENVWYSRIFSHFDLLVDSQDEISVVVDNFIFAFENDYTSKYIIPDDGEDFVKSVLKSIKKNGKTPALVKLLNYIYLNQNHFSIDEEGFSILEEIRIIGENNPIFLTAFSQTYCPDIIAGIFKSGMDIKSDFISQQTQKLMQSDPEKIIC